MVKQGEIIELLKEQLKASEAREKEHLAQIRDLTAQVRSLTDEISSLREALLKKGLSLDKQKRITRGLTKIMSNQSEKQDAKPVLSEEERVRLEEERAAKRKERGNNGARKDPHYELEVEEHDVYPDDPDFDIGKARLYSSQPRISVRFECVPMRFIKHIYKIHTYTQDGRLFEGRTPPAAFLNSNYDGSFVAGLMELRYIHSMPIERIAGYFESHGFMLRKSTAHKLMKRTSEQFENLYRCIRQRVLSDPYICGDETYYRILVRQKDTAGKGSRKGYLWLIVGMKSRMVYLIYEDGSRSENVILNELRDYKGVIQSDGYAPYRKLGSDAYPDITRIGCLQHIKRKFIDCGEDDPDARQIVGQLNRLYQNEHKHRIGEDNWTVGQNLRHRQSYAPDILADISDKLDEMESRGDLPPKSQLREAITYMRNEWNAMVDIFNYGDTNLDNNLLERLNRYISISRRNSLFFGSHKGAERGAILYTIALTCRLHRVNFFEYISDVINATAEWQPNTPLEKYRELLPDVWGKNRGGQ